MKLILAIFFFPIHSFLEKLGIRYDFAAITNTYYRKQFDNIPTSAKAVILPHCLIGDQCPGLFSKENGIICKKCKKCGCGDIRKISEEQGWQFYITPSSGFTKRLVQRKDIRAAIGAACHLEIEKGIRSTHIARQGVHIQKTKVIPQIVLTEKNDCLHNTIDWMLLERMILGKCEAFKRDITKT